MTMREAISTSGRKMRAQSRRCPTSPPMIPSEHWYSGSMQSHAHMAYDPRNPPARPLPNLFEAVAEEHLIQPTIIYDFPTAISPLSKHKPDEPDWAERFEIYVGQMEIANGFSELNDPEDQRRRFEAQLSERERGDEEAHQMDEDYVRALPTACRRPEAKASASTGSACCSPTRSPSAT